VSWFKVADASLRFRGRITTKPLTEWLTGPDGSAAVDAVAQTLRFSFIGRTRAARRRLRRELLSAVADEQVRRVLEVAPDYYLTALTELAYAPALPRVVIALRRLVVVPRTMVAARARNAVNAQLMLCPAYADLTESLRLFLCDRLVWEMDHAIGRAKPSPRRAVPARETWSCVAFDDRFVWVHPLWAGKDWLGHLMLFEMPEHLSKRERQQIEGAIDELKTSLPHLSAIQRDGAVRSALAGLSPVRINYKHGGAETETRSHETLTY
jgi:hypothetical protein